MVNDSGIIEISIPAFREEGDALSMPLNPCNIISIPAFREEGDGLSSNKYIDVVISIPAFREEGDFLRLPPKTQHKYFNTSLP